MQHLHAQRAAHGADHHIRAEEPIITLVLGQDHEASPSSVAIELIKRNDRIQTALDVIVESGGSTVGNVLIGSIPSEPTTVSLPGFGLLTMDAFLPASTTASSTGSSSSSISASTSSSSNTATASPYPTSFSGPLSTVVSANTTSFLGTMTARSGVTNSTSSFSTFTTTTAFNTSSSFLSSTTSTTFSTTTLSSSTSTSASSSTFAGGPSVAPTPAPAPTASSPAAPVNASSSGSSNAGPIVGGVVGGVAGALLLGLLVFFLVRRQIRRSSNGTRLDDGEDGASTAPVSRDGPPPPPPAMSQQPSSPLSPLAAAVGRLRPHQALAPAAAERGFTRVSGRKLTPVIRSGGDGYTEPEAGPPVPLPPPPVQVAPHLSTDFSAGDYFRDGEAAGSHAVTPHTDAAHEHAVQFRPLLPPSENSSMHAAGPSSNRNSMPPGTPAAAAAARTERLFASESPDSFDVAAGAGAASRTPSPQAMLLQGPRRTPVVSRPAPARIDPLGRSRPSLDGSRVSRFNENL